MSREEVADTVADLVHAVDALDWGRVRGVLADQVTVDYTSLFGGEVETVGGDALVTRWQSLLPGFDATQHLLGPVRVTLDGPDRARADTHLRAYHRITGEDPPEWVLAGHYRMVLQRGEGGWRIVELAVDAYYQSGDQGLVELAVRRAGSSPRRR